MILEGCLLKGNADKVIIGMYEELQARTDPIGFNDLLGEPILPDSNSDGIADDWELVRPETQITLNALVKFINSDELIMSAAGNMGDSLVSIMLFEDDLKRNGLFDISGDLKIRVNDRLLKIIDSSGKTKINFVNESRVGLFAIKVIPPDTGENLYEIVFHDRPKGPRE